MSENSFIEIDSKNEKYLFAIKSIKRLEHKEHLLKSGKYLYIWIFDEPDCHEFPDHDGELYNKVKDILTNTNINIRLYKKICPTNEVNE